MTSFEKNNEINKFELIKKLDTEAKFKQLLETLEKHKRTAYLPVTKVVKPKFSSSSKIGGLPYLRSAEDFPICPNCKNHLQLFLQLNMDEIPEKKSTGLIQLFYCTNLDPHCEMYLESFFPFSEGVVCRKIEVNGESASIDIDTNKIFEERQIIEWEAKADYPHFDEYEQLGIDIDLDYEIYDLIEERKIGLTLEGDKLFGWPCWVQSVEYPFDRQTGKQMELLFQLDSEINLPFMFGDAGIGHLTQSPDNENELAFTWACG